MSMPDFARAAIARDMRRIAAALVVVAFVGIAIGFGLFWLADKFL